MHKLVTRKVQIIASTKTNLADNLLQNNRIDFIRTFPCDAIMETLV